MIGQPSCGHPSIAEDGRCFTCTDIGFWISRFELLRRREWCCLDIHSDYHYQYRVKLTRSEMFGGKHDRPEIEVCGEELVDVLREIYHKATAEEQKVDLLIIEKVLGWQRVDYGFGWVDPEGTGTQCMPHFCDDARAMTDLLQKLQLTPNVQEVKQGQLQVTVTGQGKTGASEGLSVPLALGYALLRWAGVPPP